MEQNIDEHVNQFWSICEELCMLYECKNHDYGDAFGRVTESLNKVSPAHAAGYHIGMLRVKVERIFQCMTGDIKVKDESIEDSLKDLASYAIMTLIARRNGKRTETKE